MNYPTHIHRDGGDIAVTASIDAGDCEPFARLADGSDIALTADERDEIALQAAFDAAAEHDQAVGALEAKWDADAKERRAA